MLEYTGKPREVQELLPAELEILASMVKLAEDAGIEPIFTNAPDIRQKEYFITEAAKAGVIPTLIDLDDPAKHKNLLAPELRFDELHLRESGAALYTKRWPGKSPVIFTPFKTGTLGGKTFVRRR